MSSASSVGSVSVDLILAANLNQIGQQLQAIAKNIEGNIQGATTKTTKKMEDTFQKSFDNVQKESSRSFGGVGKVIDGALSGVKTVAENTFGVITTTAKVAGTAVAGLAATALALGTEFNKTQAEVRGALKVIVPDQFESLLKAVNELNDESPFAREVFLDLTKTMAGFGVEAEKIPQVLDGIQQAVAATGGGSDVLQGLGTQFARIASSGRITGDIVQSFASRGIDVFGLLAEEAKRAGSAISEFAGTSATELRDQFSKGAVDAATQIDALSTALQNRFGGATAEVRNTFVGAADRIRASLRNIGGDFTKFFINPLGNAAGGPGAAVDAMNLFADSLSNVRKALLPIAERIMPVLADAVVRVATFVNNLSKRLVDIKTIVTPVTRTFDELGNVIDKVGKPVEKLTSSGKPLIDMFEKLQGFLPIIAFAVTRFGAAFLGQIPVIGGFLTSLNPVAAGLVVMLGLMPQVRNAFIDAGKAILPIVQRILPSLSALLTSVQNAIAPLIGLVIRGLVAAFVAFAPVIQRVADALTGFLTNAAPGIEAFATRAAAAIEAFAVRAAAFVNQVIDTIGRAIEFVRSFFSEIGNVGTGAAFTNILGSVTGLGPVLSGLIPIVQRVAEAFGSFNVGDLFGSAVEGARSLAENLGVLEPILVGVSIAAAAIATAVGLYNIQLQIAAARTAVFALQAKLAAVAQAAMATGTFSLTGAVQGLNAAFGLSLSTIGVVAIAVAAIAAALVVLYLRVQPVRDAVDNLVDAFLNLLPTFEEVRNAFTEIQARVAAFIQLIQPLIRFLLTVGEAFIKINLVTFAVAVVAVVGVIKLLIPVVQAIAVLIGRVLVAAVNGARTILNALGEVFKSLSPVINAVTAVVRFLIDNFKLFLPVLIPIGIAIGALIIAFKLLPPIINLIASLLVGVLRAAFATISVALNTLAQIIDGVVGVFRILFNLLSGAATIIGTVIGAFLNLGDVARGVIDAIAGFGPVRAIIESVGGVVRTLINIFLEFGPVKAVIEGIRDVFGAIGGAIDGIINKAKGLGKAFNVLGRFNPFKSTKKDADDAGKAIDDVGNKTTQAGQKIEQTTKKVTEFVDNFKRIGDLRAEIAAIPAGLVASVQEATKAADPVLAAAEKAKQANEAVGAAQSGLAEATKRVNDLQKERAKIIQNTISPVKEIANAEKDLTRARFRLAEIDREIIKTQKELNEFRAFGRAEQEAALERDLERAKISANQARREEQALLAEVNKEKEKGNQETRLDINLAGLTLDQARNKLAAVRATLAAQKQGQKTEEGATGEQLTQEQIEEKKRLARLDVLDAEQRERDATRAFQGFKEEADAKDAAFQQQLIELNFQKQEQQDAINAQQQRLNELRAGETTLAQNLKQIDEQIAQAKQAQATAAARVRDAVRAARDAQREANIQAALFTGQQQRAAELMGQQLRDRAALLNLEPQVRAQLEKSLQPLTDGINKTKQLQGEIAKLGQQAVDQANSLKGLFDASVGDAGATSALLANDSLPNQLLDAANKALAVDPNDPFAKAVKDILLNLFAQRFSGFEKGGFISGVGDGFGRVIRVAERGAEAVLPLTRPFDMQRVLQDQRVLSPVLKALGTVTLPKAGTSSLIQNSTTSVRNINRGSGGGIQPGLRMEQRQQNRELAQMIAEELVAAGFEGGNVTVEAPITVEGAYNEELVARRIEDRIMKSIERRLR